jgi:hypothetical protein
MKTDLCENVAMVAEDLATEGDVDGLRKLEDAMDSLGRFAAWTRVALQHRKNDRTPAAKAAETKAAEHLAEARATLEE